jgi:hypothetical protein
MRAQPLKMSPVVVASEARQSRRKATAEGPLSILAYTAHLCGKHAMAPSLQFGIND